MTSLRLTSAFAALLLLSACAEPVTRTPLGNEQEVGTERDYQKQNTVTPQEAALSGPVSESEFKHMQERLHRIEAPIAEAGDKMCQELQATTRQQRCEFELVIDKEDGLNASADGERIMVTPAMIRFANEDPELALVISHEMAHNIMGHVASQQSNVAMGSMLGSAVDVFAASQGYDTGSTFGNLGGQAALLRYSPAFEHEADYVGLYIMANAGYPIEQAPMFWRKMSSANPNAIYTRSTHPTNPERFVMLDKTVKEIQAKRASGAPLSPEILPAR